MQDFVIYVCPVCGETLKWGYPCTATPNMIHHHVDESGWEFVVMMQLCYPPTEQKLIGTHTIGYND